MWRADPATGSVIGYPPEPWELRGQQHLTVWRVPATHLPRLSAGLKPVRAGGTALVATSWVIYEPGGVLSYRELLVAVLAYRGGRPLMTITDIWVDSDPSLRGGRELWGIPKQWASFRVNGATCAAVDVDGELIASSAVRQIGALPGRGHIRFTVAQQRAGELMLIPVRCTSKVRLIRISWNFTPGGRLGWLAGARPALSASLRDFTLCFGRPPVTGDASSQE
ncbi:MAG: acetoacetate decarboxylase family protein [Actinomycetota bacterium]|nr:acetoacetate decarboxylase family protein [Actinomycetota bacterium]